MSTALAKAGNGSSPVEQLVVMGDLSVLKAEQRLEYYSKVCESVGLNPYTRPFEYITLNGKLTLYARKDATEQLRKLNGVSVVRIERETVNDVFMVWVTMRNSTGREDVDMGAVNVAGLKGEALANAMMKAITKAKRRATLSISGLGWLDETEIETIPDAKRVVVNEQGEIVQNGGGTSVGNGSNGNGAQTTGKEDAPVPIWQTWQNGADVYAWAVKEQLYATTEDAKDSFRKYIESVGMQYKASTKDEIHRMFYEAHMALADADDVNFYQQEEVAA